MEKYQTLEDIDDLAHETAEVELDAVYNTLKAQDNPLQVIKKRRPSVYDEYR